MLPFLRMLHLHPAASKRGDGLSLEFLRREIEETLDLTGIQSEFAALPPGRVLQWLVRRPQSPSK